MNRKLREEVDKFKPDCLLTLKGELIFPETIQEISESVSTLLYYFDVHPPDKVPLWLKEIAPAYHHFLTICPDPEWTSQFKGANVKYFPEAYCSFTFEPVEVNEKERSFYGSDCCFFGTDNHESRAIALRAVADAGYELKIWGNQFHRLWIKYGVNKFWRGYRTSDLEACKICASTPIILGFRNCPGYDFSKSFSARVYQTLGAEGFLLEEKSKDFERVFHVGRHLDVWKDVDDLLAKIKYYLSPVGRRRARAMARRGRRYVEMRHSWLVRMRELLQKLEGEWTD